MGRKRSGSALAVILGVVAVMIVWAMLRAGQWWTLIELCALAGVCAGVWVLFFKRARCGYVTQRHRPCRNPVRGELRGCTSAHKGLKAEALFNHFGLRHPRQRMQQLWLGNGEPERPRLEEPGRLARPVYDTVTLCATVLSAIASVVMPVVQMAVGK